MPTTNIERPRFARMYLKAAGNAERRGATEHRRRLLHGLSGTVVEVGAGHGLNFPHYPAEVTEVIAIEPEPTLRASATEAAADAPVRVRVLAGVADELPLKDESVDAAVASLVLCSGPDQERALAELRRVLRPRWRAALLRARHPQLPTATAAAPGRRPQRPVAPHRRRLSPRPRHDRGDRARGLCDRVERAADVRRRPLRARDPLHPRQRSQELVTQSTRVPRPRPHTTCGADPAWAETSGWRTCVAAR